MIKSVNPVHGRFWTPLIQLGRLQLLMPHTDEQRTVLLLNFVKVPPSSRRASLCSVCQTEPILVLCLVRFVFKRKGLSSQHLNHLSLHTLGARNIHTYRVPSVQFYWFMNTSVGALRRCDNR